MGNILKMLSLSKFSVISPENSSFIAMCRGVAALVVVLAHMEQVFLAPTWPGAYVYSRLISQVSVMVFFVLSGFLIGKSITRKTAAGTFSFGPYVADRAWRILPPLGLAFAVMLCLYVLAPLAFPSGAHQYLPTQGYVVVTEFTLNAQGLLASALFLNGFFAANPLVNGPLWSLSFEVWLYLIAGLVVMGQRWRVSILLAACLLAVLSVRNHSFAAYSVVWAAGFVLCLLHNNRTLAGAVRAALAVLGPLSAIVGVGLASRYIAQADRLHNPLLADYRYVIAFNVFIGLAFCCLLGVLLDRRSPSPRVLQRTADFSYTLYIVHFPILLFLFGILQPRLQGSIPAILSAAAATFVGVVLFAHAAAKIVEDRNAILRAVGFTRGASA